MSPPTVCIVALTVWQLGLVMLARPRVSAWLARRGPWTAVIAVGSMAMTLYLWHLPANGRPLRARPRRRRAAAQRVPGGRPGRRGWRRSWPRWRWPCPASSGPAARPAPPRGLETPGGRVAAVLGVALVSLGLLGFMASGFTPLLDPHGSPLLVLRVDPLQNALHLAVGAALPLASPSAAPVGVVLHLAVVAVALAVAAGMRRG
ncbi:MAG TPA: DUF4383 domain-containing protein [Actinomycetota bacterium]|nr:DUF4383 domain-containing protein [Actinomycetota bacterium]